MRHAIVLAENERRERYRRLPPLNTDRPIPKAAAKWAHMILDGVTGPPYTSRVFLAPLATVGRWCGEVIVGGARCRIMLPVSVLLDRDCDAIFDELLGAGTVQAARQNRARLKGDSAWLSQNMHR